MKRILLGFVCLVAFARPALAESSLSLEQALEIAILHNPKLQASRAKLGISDAGIASARARVNPFLVSDNGIAEKTYRLGISQTFELGGKRKKRIELSQVQRGVVLSEVSTQLLVLRNEVRKAYVSLYNLQERQKTYEHFLSTTQELVTIAQKREQAGDISKLDVLQTEIVNVNTNNDLQTNAIALQQAKDTLASLLNQPVNPDVQLLSPDLLPSFEVEPKTNQTSKSFMAAVSRSAISKGQLIETAFKNRPEIQQMVQSINVAKIQRSIAMANRIPNLNLTAGPDLVVGTEKALNLFVIGNVEVPLLNRQQGPIAEAEARMQQLELELRAFKNTVNLEVTNAFTAYVLNQQRLQRYESQLLPYSAEVVNKSKSAFREGKASILMPINAEQAFINTQLSYLQALADYQNAISDLERAVGAGL